MSFKFYFVLESRIRNNKCLGLNINYKYNEEDKILSSINFQRLFNLKDGIINGVAKTGNFVWVNHINGDLQSNDTYTISPDYFKFIEIGSK